MCGSGPNGFTGVEKVASYSDGLILRTTFGKNEKTNFHSGMVLSVCA